MASTVGLNQDAAALQKRIEHFQSVREQILGQVRQVIVGQQEVLDQILIAIFVGGLCLMTGLPGTAKTLMVRTIADALGLQFRRIQFTPDLMPSDITGTDIIEEDLATGRALYSVCWRLRTRSNGRERIRYPRRNWTASCSTPYWTT